MLKEGIFARKAPTQKRAQKKVECILEGAAEVLIKEGSSALNTNSVARYSGVTVGSIYQYYPKKEAILFALYQRWLDRAYTIYTTYRNENADLCDTDKYYRGLIFAFYKDSSEKDHRLSVELTNALNTNDALISADEIHNRKLIDELHKDAIRLQGIEDTPQTRLQSKINFEIIIALMHTTSKSDPDEREFYIQNTIKIGVQLLKR